MTAGSWLRRALRAGVVFALCMGAMLFASAVAARREGGTADLLVQGAVAQNPTLHPVASRPFFLFATVFNNGPDPSSFTLHIQLPDGVEYTPEPNHTCSTGSSPHDLICAGPNNPAPVGDDGSGTFGSFSASKAGSYDFVIQLSDLGATDPNPANNRTTVTVTVLPAPVLVPYRLSVTPASPRAGRPFSVSFVVIDKSTAKRQIPGSARCASSLGHARARLVGPRVACTVTTTTAASGKLVDVRLSAVVGSMQTSHTFAIRLR